MKAFDLVEHVDRLTIPRPTVHASSPAVLRLARFLYTWNATRATTKAWAVTPWDTLAVGQQCQWMDLATEALQAAGGAEELVAVRA